MTTVLRQIDAFVAAYPMLFSTVITGTKAWLADMIVQIWYEKSPYDQRRGAVFGIFGCTYQGVFQYLAFNHVLEPHFPGASLRNVGIKVFVSNAILDPCCFFPCFYTTKEALARERIDVDVVTAGISSYATNCVTDCINSWCVWLPAHCVTYGLVPVRWRMPWVACVSFGSYPILVLWKALTLLHRLRLPPFNNAR